MLPTYSTFASGALLEFAEAVPLAENLALGLHSRLGHLDKLAIPERRIPIREAG